MIAYRNSSSTVSFVNIVVIVAPRTSGDAHTPRILASTVLLENTSYAFFFNQHILLE
jgi:hypothetical protein